MECVEVKERGRKGVKRDPKGKDKSARACVPVRVPVRVYVYSRVCVCVRTCVCL